MSYRTETTVGTGFTLVMLCNLFFVTCHFVSVVVMTTCVCGVKVSNVVMTTCCLHCVMLSW